MKGLLRNLCLLLLLLFLCVFTGCEGAFLRSSLLTETSEEILFQSNESEREAEETLSEEAPIPPKEDTPIDGEGEAPTNPAEEPSPPFTEDPPEDETAQPDPLYIEPISDYEKYMAVCAAANVNLRAGQGTDTPILGCLGVGRSLPHLERCGEWYAVLWEERIAYVSAAYSYLAETCRATERIIEAGLQKLGAPYVWGAARILNGEGEESPYFTGKSFDCSSFLQYCFYVGDGVKLGNYTGSQADYTRGEIITRYSDLRRGDFYFTGEGKISHVVLYMGGGRLLQAYSANGGPVSFTTDDRWKGKFISGRRVDLSVKEQYE
ncbi:MAG: C40 family peptidase [Clostridia bacterium]|nr:C40 family peptidase [Clostridia bacterium]